MTGIPLCNICRIKPCEREKGSKGYRRHCGSPDCVEATQLRTHVTSPWGWPRRDGKDTADFSRHNIKFRRRYATGFLFAIGE